MKFNGFIVAIVVLAALGAALYWSNHHMPSETTRASAETPPKILTLNEADINKIDIKKKGGEEVTLTKDNGGNWKGIAPKPLGADQSDVSSMLYSLSSPNSDRLVEEKASNFNQYGLSEPTLQIGVTEKNSKTHQLLVGDDTPTNNGAYVRVEGDRRVFTLAAYNKTTLDKSVNDLRDKRLLTLESDKISRIELTANKQEIEFGRNKDQWQILRPKPLRADSAQVDELLRKLTDAKMEASSVESLIDKLRDLQASKFLESGFNTPAIDVIVSSNDGKRIEKVLISKYKDSYIAKRENEPVLYELGSKLIEALQNSAKDLKPAAISKK